jgi:predicted ribosome quality control (RQC) complex YloA/Tae2 family protein
VDSDKWFVGSSTGPTGAGFKLTRPSGKAASFFFLGVNSKTLEIITKELSAELTGRRFGKVFQLGRRNEFAFDLRPGGSRYLYIDLRPGDPGVYLISRRLKDLERSSGNLYPFSLTLRKQLSGAEVVSVRKFPGERVLELELTAEDELGSVATKRLIVQLTGRSANLFLADRENVIMDRSRDTLGDGQQIGSVYSPPARDKAAPTEERIMPSDTAAAAASESPSEALDTFYAERTAEQEFQSLARSAAAKISAEIRKREKLVANLKSDLAAHGNAEEWKRIGDLLLSNASTARREADAIYVTDYFDEALPEIAVEADENDSVTETAEKYYRRYTKARNASAEIAARLEKLDDELVALERRRDEIDQAIAEKDFEFLENVSGKKKPPATAKEAKKTAETGGVARRFVSSDGFEILVGKRAKDNDVLTFKIAKSLDTWMHAADYPGSHVVIRNPNRADIPPRTLHEAARLAAFYSRGKSQVKAAVHYTLKKFVNKPKGAAPGLVSLASFKTLLVEAGVPDGIKAV